VVSADAIGRGRAGLVFLTPRAPAKKWTQTTPAPARRPFPAPLFEDEAVGKAKTFHALHLRAPLLYGEEGRIALRWWDTGARGHVGENAGQENLIAAAFRTAPVW